MRRKYRWDRIAGVAGSFCLLCLLLVAWISPDEPTDAAELEHPGEGFEPSDDAHSDDAQRDAGQPEVRSTASEAEPSASRSSGSNSEKNSEKEIVLPCSCNKGVLKLPKNPYTAHQEAARNLPNSFFVKDKNELNAGKSRGKLVSVSDGRGYHIAPLSHSYAVLLPEVKKLLQDMGNAFADQLEGTDSEGTTFRVTSLTRTARQQDRLGRRNYNAIDDASTHSYGASFDIAYTDRPNNAADCSAPTRAIQHVLSSFQKSGRILVIPEKNCMHITLRP